MCSGQCLSRLFFLLAVSQFWLHPFPTCCLSPALVRVGGELTQLCSLLISLKPTITNSSRTQYTQAASWVSLSILLVCYQVCCTLLSMHTLSVEQTHMQSGTCTPFVMASVRVLCTPVLVRTYCPTQPVPALPLTTVRSLTSHSSLFLPGICEVFYLR